MSTLSDFISRLESGGGVNAARQPASMVDPVYGQYSPFAQQYGSGAAGVDNYASQVLAANPGATIGDFYSGYVLGTGNPASLPGASALQAQYPAAYSNLTSQLANAGYTLDTPLSSLTSGTSAAGGSYVTAPDAFSPSSPTASPTASAQDPTIDPTTGQPYTDWSTALGPFTSAEGLFGPSSPLTVPGASGAPLNPFAPNATGTGAPGGGLAQIFQAGTNYLTRGGLILLGVGLVIVAAWAAARGEFGGQAAKVVRGEA